MSNPFDSSVTPGASFEVGLENPLLTIETKTNCQDLHATARIACMEIANTTVAIALTNNMVIRYELDKGGMKEEIRISKEADDLVHKIFLDPNGRHCIISMQSGENYYLPKNAKAPLPIKKAKGNLIECVGWNNKNTEDNSTKEILIGTTSGIIYETLLEEGKFFNASVEQYWLPVIQASSIGEEITGIEFDRMPISDVSSGGDTHYFILVTTPGRLYQFVGHIPAKSEQPIFQSIFSHYERKPGGLTFHELPGNFGYSDLKLYNAKFRKMPDSFAWMTGPGIYYGRVDASGNLGSENIIAEKSLIEYPTIQGERIGRPVGIALTQFHVIIAYVDRIKVVCVLNHELVYSHLTEYELQDKIMGIRRDPIAGNIWLYTSRDIFQVKLINEKRNIWQVYLDRSEFKLATNFCSNASQKNIVAIREAEYQYDKEDYLKSAERFADSDLLFEEVALKFIHLPDKEPLKYFLLSRVYSLEKNASLEPTSTAKMTLLALWLVEVFLNQLGRLKDSTGMQNVKKHEEIQQEFYKFLKMDKIKNALRSTKQTVYDLLDSHGNIQDVIFFADIMKDHERVVKYHIQQENYHSALLALKNQADPEMHYHYGPVLISHYPEDTINTWIKMGRSLKPERLLPSLLKAKPNLALTYLEFAVNQLQTRNENVHNLLVSHYSEVGGDKLLHYLEREGSEAHYVPYDPQYAMRVCAEYKNIRASVFLYKMLGLYEEAVMDALNQKDIEFAKEIARNPMIDSETSKKLWLCIAHHVVEKNKDVKEATKIVEESRVLKLEDILPFFPEFVTIDYFKEAICESLNRYNEDIEALRKDMTSATNNAARIRNQIQAFRLRYATVELDDVCAECNLPLLLKTFYLFPCGHYFHTDCLEILIKPYLPADKLHRFEAITASMNKTTSSDAVHSFRVEYDEIIASDCVFCGVTAIENVDKLFIDSSKYECERQKWD